MIYNNLPITDKKLGANYNKKKTLFRVWSPLRDKIDLLIYRDAYSLNRVKYQMIKGEDGTHELTVEGDLKGYYYNYLIEDTMEVTDPYAISSSKNSIRSAIIDLKTTDPEGWGAYTRPGKDHDHTPIIYEVHIKDFTAHPSAQVENRGKYLGFVEEKPLNHLKDLGVSHIHLMPVYDFLTVNEDKGYFLRDNNYNWGYDPELYNVAEGSYTTDPEDPVKRVKELKTMIMELHKAGLKVILDVVYNHTYRSKDSNFNVIMPDYYYRQNQDGSFSNGSGCGNELATERPMVRKFIVESLKYWVEEYKVDGFRFDLMSLIDIHTIDGILYELRKINPHILIYGEPWAADQTPLAYQDQISKGKQQGRGFALFNDDFRDGVKGDNDGQAKGFIQGNLNSRLAVETGIVGSTYYDDGHIGFTTKASQSINYINSHDNLIIRDKIKRTLPFIDINGQKRLNKLAFSILLTSQGIPFFHAGNEFLRTKHMEHNSYNLPLSINAIDWRLKEEHLDFYNYFKDLIKLRKTYREFNLDTEEEIKERIKFMKFKEDSCIIAYTIAMEEGKGCLLVVHNGNQGDYIITKGAIREHISKNCKAGSQIKEIIPILDLGGLVEKEENIFHYHGIEIPYSSTMVYRIK